MQYKSPTRTSGGAGFWYPLILSYDFWKPNGEIESDKFRINLVFFFGGGENVFAPSANLTVYPLSSMYFSQRIDQVIGHIVH